MTLARIERAEEAVARAEEDGDLEKLARLRHDLRSWVSVSLRLLDALGLTPLAHARLGLDTAMTRRALTAVELHAAADVVEGEAVEDEAGPDGGS